jgi:hypothetical protein
MWLLWSAHSLLSFPFSNCAHAFADRVQALENALWERTGNDPNLQLPRNPPESLLGRVQLLETSMAATLQAHVCFSELCMCLGSTGMASTVCMALSAKL